MGRKPKISVMNLTARYGGIDILWANMKRQTFQDWELVIVDALWREREREVKEYINDPRLKYIRQNDPLPEAYTNLAHADNQGFANCDGELIVCLQDYIWIPPRGLEKFWEAHKAYKGQILITGVGHQYAKPGKEDIVNERGKITIFKKPYTEKPTVQCWTDPRMTNKFGTFYEVNPPDIEFNWAAIPRKVIYELGGMDEEYDFYGFAFDNVNIAMRADMLGYKPYIDQTNECMGFSHDDWAINPAKKTRSNEIAQFHRQRMKEILEGKRSIRLDYLSKYVKMRKTAEPEKGRPAK